MKDTETPLRYSKRRTAFATAEATLINTDLTSSQEDDDQLLTVQARLAEDAAWLLQRPAFAGYQKNHRDHYVHLLYERGFCTYSGVLDRRKLANDLISHYSHDLLASMKCEMVSDGREEWVHRLAHRDQRAIHPIHHLLLLQFLDQSLESFLNHPDRGVPLADKDSGLKKDPPPIVTPFYEAPFGTSPWPCLNPVCAYFQQDVVNT